jgi:membrane-associated phospholipid phosphatase
MRKNFLKLDNYGYCLLRRPSLDRELTIAAVAGAAILVRRDQRQIKTTLCAITASEIIKLCFLRPRPYQKHNHLRPSRQWRRSSSFPSSHSAGAFAAAVATRKPPLIALGAVLSLTRVSGGQHYPSDVIGGALIGTAVGLVLSK